MDKNILGTKIGNGKGGGMTQVIKSFQETFNGFTEAKTTSTNPQFLDSNSEKRLWELWEKKNLPKPTNRESLLVIHSIITKMDFWA